MPIVEEAGMKRNNMKETLVKPNTFALAQKLGHGEEISKDDKTLLRKSSLEGDVAPVQVPTQSLLQQWLRTQFNVHICLSYNKYWRYHIHILKKGMTIEGYALNATSEGALENGLRMAMRLIKI